MLNTKRALQLALAVLLLSVPVFAAEVPFTAGLQTNPPANTILADSGPIDALNQTGTDTIAIPFKFVAAADVTALVMVEWRTAANDANVWSQPYPVQAFSTVEGTEHVFLFHEGERVRLRLINGIASGPIAGAGHAQGTIFLK